MHAILSPCLLPRVLHYAHLGSIISIQHHSEEHQQTDHQGNQWNPDVIHPSVGLPYSGNGNTINTQ